jgi:hypothetical protein
MSHTHAHTRVRKNVAHARAHTHTPGSSIRAMRIRGREHVEMSVHPDTTGENTA